MVKLLMVILGAFSPTTASAQTASELADKYAHHEVYEVQPGVQMTRRSLRRTGGSAKCK